MTALHSQAAVGHYDVDARHVLLADRTPPGTIVRSGPFANRQRGPLPAGIGAQGIDDRTPVANLVDDRPDPGDQRARRLPVR
jgi:hypothetical protein